MKNSEVGRAVQDDRDWVGARMIASQVQSDEKMKMEMEMEMERAGRANNDERYMENARGIVGRRIARLSGGMSLVKARALSCGRWQVR